MIATPNIKIKLLKPFLVLCLMVGAFFFAPSVSAISQTSSADEWVEYICTQKNLNTSDVVYMYRSAVDEFNGNEYIQVCVFDVSNVDYVSFNCDTPEGTPAVGTQYGYKLYSNNCPFYNNLYYWDSLYIGDYPGNISQSSGDTWFSNISARDSSYNYTFTNPVNWNCNFDISHITTNDSFVTFNALSLPVETDSQSYADAMLQEYLHSEGFTSDMSTAWLIAPSGQPTQIPMSYTTPTNYSGDVWVQVQNVSPYLDKFSPRFSDNFNAVDYAGYKLAVSYDIDVSYVKLYSLTDKEFAKTSDFTLYINDTIRQDSSVTLPQTKGYYDFDGVTYFGSLYEQDNNTLNERELLYCIWDFNPSALAAIPRFAPLYCALDVRTVDSDGNTVISRDSNDYRQFVTNYNQKAISGLTGSYTGNTFSKQDWRGQSVSQDVDYRNDFTITYDSNLGQVFRTIFSMGNGYILTLCIGGLSIAFAAYVLFGKH